LLNARSQLRDDLAEFFMLRIKFNVRSTADRRSDQSQAQTKVITKDIR